MPKSNTSFEIIKIPVGQMAANCYLVAEKSTKKTMIIDPGDVPEYLKEVIIREKLLPQVIIATHGHFDHIMGVLDLQLSLKIPFLASSRDDFLITRMAGSAKHFLSIDPGPPPKPTMHLKEGHIVNVGRLEFKVLETPGHTPGSICLVNSDAIFTGDTLFSQGGVGRTDFSYSKKGDLDKSIKRILSLPKNTTILPGHGDSSTIENERKNHNS
ncbi:MBL fold metallo-hydrolase [Candidatus Gottesmanbacteria bacterium]|nr:MBL fold metallo-hydrolase [Candidatus Gottesmanbacteria bacterium]